MAYPLNSLLIYFDSPPGPLDLDRLRAKARDRHFRAAVERLELDRHGVLEAALARGVDAGHVQALGVG